jgi:tetratricopeptide (TPR) repeat protein
VTLLLAALFLGQTTRPADDSWAQLFGELWQLEHTDRSTPAFQALAKSLDTRASTHEREGLKKKDNVEKYRARLILHHLDRLRGVPPRAVTVPDAEPAWVPHEGWFAARALAPSWYRVQAGILALDETPSVEPERAVLLGRIADEERALLRLDLAEGAAAAVFRRVPSDANALRLARILTLRGSNREARDVLSRALDVTQADAARARLFCARAGLAQGSRDERAALADWGAALLLGSDEAALDLAERALADGERERARVLAAAVLSRSADAQAQGTAGALGETLLYEAALEAWGKALLPPSRQEPLAGAPGKVP